MENGNEAVLTVDKKIVAIELLSENKDAATIQESKSSVTQEKSSVPERQEMNEKVARPTILESKTYKISAVSTYAYYVTISDIVLNEGTEYEEKRPFEIFINTRDTENAMWTVAMTRTISAVFRKGGDITFLIDQLRTVVDPRGGYWKGGKWKNSIVSEIADVIEQHLLGLNLIEKPKPLQIVKSDATLSTEVVGVRHAQCPNCLEYTFRKMEGCMTCTNCTYSKCG